MGAANVIPGVSGGTIALLTGIFTEIIDSLNAMMDPASWKLLFQGKFREFWRFIHGTFLVSLSIGVLISIFSLAKLMVYVMNWYPVQTWAFFFGLIIASSAYMIYDIKGWKVNDVLFFRAGIVLGVVICTLSPTTTPDSLWFIFLCGAIAVCTMISSWNFRQFHSGNSRQIRLYHAVYQPDEHSGAAGVRASAASSASSDSPSSCTGC